MNAATRRFLLPAIVAFALATPAGAANASSLTYFGGPVVHSINVVLVEWGPSVRSSYTDQTSGDPGLFGYLASQSGSTTDIGGVLAQYMDTSGHNSSNRVSYGGAVQVAPSSNSTTVDDSTIQSELKSNIQSSVLPAPSGDGLSTIYVVLFPPGDTVCQGGVCSNDPTQGFCAYHGSFPDGAAHVLYAAMVDNGPGTDNYGFCGSSANDVHNQTSVVSHEFAEAINDPLVAEASVFGPPLGWYDRTFNGEIADKCDSQPLTTNGPWTVEPLWSNHDAACVAGEAAFSPPTASFTAPGPGAAGSPLTFDATASSDSSADHTSATYAGSSYSVASGITGYDWSWGDGSPDGTSPTAAHTYAADGAYDVTLTVTDDIGFTGSITHQVIVGNPPPALATGAADSVTDQAATVHGSIDTYGQAATYDFAYGTSPSALSDSTTLTAAPSGTVATPVSATLSGLSPSTTYYYRLDVDQNGHTYSGAVQSFTTAAVPSVQPSEGSGAPTGGGGAPAAGAPQTPVAGTGGASAVGSGAAVLNGTVNPGGPAAVSYSFTYGTSSLSHATSVSGLAGGTTARPVHAAISGLKPRTRYYFRIQVQLAGRTYLGSVQSFTTRPPAPHASTGRPRVHGVAVTLSGVVDPHGSRTRYHFELGRKRSAYKRSSGTASAGSGKSAKRITMVVPGLRPHTVYHYRLVAVNAGGTSVGIDRTFKTGAAPPPGPRLSLAPLGRQTLSHALAHGLVLRYRCSGACRVSSSAAPVVLGISGIDPVAITLARGRAGRRHGGSGPIALHFSSAARARLRSARSLELLVSGVAEGPFGTFGTPATARLALGR